MNNQNFTKNDLINLLIKKASGFYYSEEQYEYEKTQNKSNLNKIHSDNISFFDNCDRGLSNINNNDVKIESNNDSQKFQENTQNLTLIKKKVATHYISPDINAIKILLEIFENKVGENDLEKLTDEELINLKNSLLKELSNEIIENK